MILSDLFEAAESPLIESKRMMKEWRDSAAGKWQLTIDTSGSNASNGFPVVRKAGTWYGGKFTPRGGDKKEADRIVSIITRTKGWIHNVLAPSLEALIDSGREVRVSSFSNGSSDKDYHLKVALLKKGEVASQLQKYAMEKLVDGQPRIGLFWWVSASEEASANTTLNVSVAYKQAGKDLMGHFAVAAIMPKPEALDFERRFRKFIINRYGQTPPTPEKTKEVNAACLSILKAFAPGTEFDPTHPLYFGIERGAASKQHKMVDAEELKQVLGKHE